MRPRRWPPGSAPAGRRWRRKPLREPPPSTGAPADGGGGLAGDGTGRAGGSRAEAGGPPPSANSRGGPARSRAAPTAGRSVGGRAREAAAGAGDRGGVGGRGPARLAQLEAGLPCWHSTSSRSGAEVAGSRLAAALELGRGEHHLLPGAQGPLLDLARSGRA